MTRPGKEGIGAIFHSANPEETKVIDSFLKQGKIEIYEKSTGRTITIQRSPVLAISPIRLQPIYFRFDGPSDDGIAKIRL